MRVAVPSLDATSLNAAALDAPDDVWLAVGVAGGLPEATTDERTGVVCDAEDPTADPSGAVIRRAAWLEAGGAHEGARAGWLADLILRCEWAGWDVRRVAGGRAAPTRAARDWLGRRHPERFARDRLGALLPLRAREPRDAAEIAVLVERFPELSQTFVVSEVAALGRAGRTVRVEALRRAGKRNPECPPGLPAAYTEDDGRVFMLLALLWLAVTRPRAVLRDARDQSRWRAEHPTTLRQLAPLAWRLRRHGVQHLQVHFATVVALDGLRLARLLRLPWSVTAHAHEIYREPANLPEKLAAATFVTSGCDYTVRDLRALMPAARADDVHRIVMGVDAERFRRTAPYPGGRHLLAVGRLVEKKGFTHLVAALADVPGAMLTLIGDGPLRADLEAQAQALGVADRVTFAGARAPAEIRAALEAADVLVMPCVVAADGDRDSMPVVVKEALAMAIPVVGTREVGLPELIEDAWGRLARPGDAADLAAAIRDLLALPGAERAEMGERGRRHVEAACNTDTEAARLLELVTAARRRAA